MSGMDRLTDHRRASQAATALIYHGDLSILPDTEDELRDMMCAPAPSDGLREVLEDARDVMAGLAEHILKADRVNTKGMFADLQRARLAADAALSASPAQEGDRT